jgi:CoA:oxalate CoA-transferase
MSFTINKNSISKIWRTLMNGALSGIRVLDLTNVFSGPYCSLLLKELGAEVIKVERTGYGDVVRKDAPLTDAGESAVFVILNRGKKSITLNIADEKGREIIKKLVKMSDVLLENFSPGTMDKLGFGSKDMLALNPRLIYASLSAYGQTGPKKNFPGFDPVLQALGGLSSVNGQPDSPPTKCAVSIGDFGTGLYLAYAIMGALFHRERTGEGQVVDVSIQDCIWMLTSIEFSPGYFLKGKVPKRLGNGHPIMIPGNMYPTKDGNVIISVGVLAMVHRLYRAMGREDLINTPMGQNQDVRVNYRNEIDTAISDWTKTHTGAEVESILKKADVPCGIVPTFDQVCHDEQLKARGMITEVEQTMSGKITVPGSVFKMSKTPGNLNYPAPMLGEFNDEIYSGLLGMSEKEIEELSSEHII